MIFKPAQLDRYIKNPDKAIKGFVVYGANEGLQAETVKALIKTVSKDINDPFQVVYLNGVDVNSDAGLLFGEYGAQSLMGGKRVIVVQDADNNLTKHLKSMLETVVSDALLVIYSSSLNKKSSLVALAESRDDFGVFACYEDRDEDVFSTVRQILIEGGYRIGNEALQLMCSRLSNDRKSNLSEINKLMVYKGELKEITVEDVKESICDQSASSNEDVCYYAASGNIKGNMEKALKAYRKLLNEGNEPIAVVRSLIYHFMKLVACLAIVEKGETIDKAIYKLTPRIMFFRESSFKQQMSLWKKDKLFAVLELLYKCEKDCKTTNIPADDVVSYAIMQIASEAARLSRYSGY